MNKQRVIVLICAVLILWKCFDYFIVSDKNNDKYIVQENNGEMHSKEMFKISIYYEALCSDSRFFILKQLIPTYDKLHDYMILDFVPYGKAEVPRCSLSGNCFVLYYYFNCRQ